MNQDGGVRRKKVLFLITKATWGGAQRYVFDLATHLDTKRFEPLVAYGTTGKLSDDLRRAGVKTFELPSLGRDIEILSDVKSFFQIIRCVQNIRPDVLHLNSSKAAALGALAGRMCGVPKIIFTVHGWPFKEDRSFLTRKLIYFVSWFTALLSHAVIVVSKEDEAQGKKMSLVGKKVHYVPIGIEKIFFQPTEELRELTQTIAAFERPEMASWPRIITIAELTANKGQLIAIEAIAQLKRGGINVTYTLAGSGEDAQFLQKRADELGVLDRVNFANFVPDASRFLRAFNIFLLPSIKEGMPYVLLEAAAAGLPIVATDVVKAEASRLPNIHFVPPGNAQALADAVGKLAQNLPAQKPAMIGSFANMLEETIALYS
ncbi:MAG: glycosyltransferase [Patescibacteria group bacterium]